MIKLIQTVSNETERRLINYKMMGTDFLGALESSSIK